MELKDTEIDALIRFCFCNNKKQLSTNQLQEWEDGCIQEQRFDLFYQHLQIFLPISLSSMCPRLKIVIFASNYIVFSYSVV